MCFFIGVTTDNLSVAGFNIWGPDRLDPVYYFDIIVMIAASRLFSRAPRILSV